MYIHSFEKQVWSIKFHQSHHKFDLSIEIHIRALEVLTKCCINHLQSLLWEKEIDKKYNIYQDRINKILEL